MYATGEMYGGFGSRLTITFAILTIVGVGMIKERVTRPGPLATHKAISQRAKVEVAPRPEPYANQSGSRKKRIRPWKERELSPAEQRLFIAAYVREGCDCELQVLNGWSDVPGGVRVIHRPPNGPEERLTVSADGKVSPPQASIPLDCYEAMNRRDLPPRIKWQLRKLPLHRN